MGRLDLILMAAGLGAAQLFFTWLFRLKLRREASERAAPYAPAVTVIVPARDDSEGLAAGVEALLAQEYEGRREFVFVTADAADPAHRRLREVLQGRPGLPARLVVSGVKSERCAAKLANLLGALPHVCAESEVLLFTDSDLVVPPGWLRRLVAPLRDPGIGAASSAMVYLPRGGFWGLLRAMWMAASVVYFAVLERVAGQSLALRRRDFEAWGVAEVWGASLLEDMPVAALVRRRGLKVAFVSSAMPRSGEGCGARGFFSVFNRWIVCFRVYDTFLWLLGLLVTLMKCWIVLRGAWLGAWAPALCLWGLDALNLAWVFALLGLDRTGRAAVCAPLLWAAYAVNFGNSLISSTVVWAGRRYRIRGPQEVRVC